MKNWLKISLVASTLLATSTLFIGCGDDEDTSTKATSLNLRIAESTDIHGQIFPYDFVNAVEDNRSMAHIYSIHTT